MRVQWAKHHCMSAAGRALHTSGHARNPRHLQACQQLAGIRLQEQRWRRGSLQQRHRVEQDIQPRLRRQRPTLQQATQRTAGLCAIDWLHFLRCTELTASHTSAGAERCEADSHKRRVDLLICVMDFCWMMQDRDHLQLGGAERVERMRESLIAAQLSKHP